MLIDERTRHRPQRRIEMHRGFRNQTWALVATMLALATLVYTALVVG